MRINRNMLLKLANDAVEKCVASDRTIVAAYLQGSLLGDSPLLGNTADIDLFFIHVDEVVEERQIVRVSDEVHLDISHHAHRLYRQPRQLRVHPWLGPAVYGCKILYDPQHFVDFVQASVRGQFANPENVLSRVRQQAEHAREIWEAFIDHPHPPGPQDASTYLRGLEHAANAIAGLHGQNLTERRFLLDLPSRVEAVYKSGLYPGFLGLLGASSVEAETIRAWLNEWRNAYLALPRARAPIRLHPDRLFYYAYALEFMMNEQSAHNALWPLWRTWTHIICALPKDSPHHKAWQNAGEQLGLLGSAFAERLQGMDAYLDTVEEIIDTWAHEHGG
jgi:hypothetical protein